MGDGRQRGELQTCPGTCGIRARIPADRGVGDRIGAVKIRDLVRLIESDGWKHVRTTGSHRHFKHATKPHVVTVPGKPGDEIPTGTLKAILKSAGLEDKR